jgi:A/G-specific adenine glycosylase
LAEGCLALERETVGDRPGRKEGGSIPEREVLVLVAVEGGEEGPYRFLLRKRPTEGLLAGMWEFPGLERGGEDEGGEGVQKGVAVPGLEVELRELGRSLDVPVDSGSVALPPVIHRFTHLKLHYRPLFVRMAAAARPPEPGDGIRWVSGGELAELPMPVAQRRIAREALRRLKGRRGE